MEVGKESKASKHYRKNSKKNNFKQFGFFFSPPPSVDGSGVREANGQRLTSKQLTLNKQIINRGFPHSSFLSSPPGGWGVRAGGGF